jgi:hypothetical protein
MEHGVRVFMDYVPYIVALLIVRVVGGILQAKVREWWRR